MHNKRTTRFALAFTASIAMLALTGCEPIVLERHTSPNINTSQEVLKAIPSETAYVVALNLPPVSSIVEDIKKACPNITIVDAKELNKIAKPAIDERALPEIVAQLSGKGSVYPRINIIIAVDTTGFRKGHFGVPPYDFRSGASTYTFYALMLRLDKGEPATRLNVQITTGGSAFLFPLPVVLETVDELAPETAAINLLSHEIVRYLATSHKTEPFAAVVVTLSPEGMNQERQFEGCAGTWQEIKNCADENR